MKNAPLIMLHGWAMPSAIFGPLRQLLEPRYPTLSPGLPGYDGSPWRFEASFETQIEQMGRDLSPGRLLGWSLGGLYALALASRYPRKFSAVTLIASSPCFTRQTDWDCALDAALLDSFGAELALDRERCLRRFVALQMQGESDARRLARALWQQLLATRSPDQEVLRFGLELLGNLDLRAGMAALEQPLKLILGEHDRLVPIALSQQIAEVAPGIQVESVAGAAHAPFLSNPQAIAACL